MATSGIKRKPRGKPFEPGNKIGNRFQPGQSGNLAGRPKSFGDLIREHTGEGAELVTFALKVLRGESVGKRTIVAPDVPKEVDVVPELRDRIEAMKWLADRGWGRPMQQITTTTTSHFETMTDAELERTLADLGVPTAIAH